MCDNFIVMARCKYDWNAVLTYRLAGHTLKESRRKFGFTFAAWYKAIERGAIEAPHNQNKGGTKRYDWTEIQRYYDQGHSIRECMRSYGFNSASWYKASQRGKIKARPQRMSIETLLAVPRNRYHVKNRLLRAGLLQEECSHCGLSEWRGRKLCIQIDHINGIKNDNRLENLRMLCPNCHSQTETFGARNRRAKRRSRVLSAASEVVAPARFELACRP